MSLKKYHNIPDSVVDSVREVLKTNNDLQDQALREKYPFAYEKPEPAGETPEEEDK